MKHWIAVGLVALLVAGCQSSKLEAVDPVANVHFKLGQGHFSEGLYTEALAEFQRAWEKQALPEFEMHVGLALWRLTKWNEAELKIRSACQALENYSECWNNLATFYNESKRYDLAIDAANVALKDLTFSGRELALLNRAYAHLQQSRYSKSYKDLSDAVAIRPESCVVRMHLANYHYERQNFDQAMAAVEAAIGSCRSNPNPQLWKAFLNARLGNRLAAKRLYNDIRRRFDNSSLHEFVRASLHQLSKKLPLEKPGLY